MPAMSITVAGTTTDFDQDEKPKRDVLNLSSSESPLARKLGDEGALWLMNHVNERWGTLHGSLGEWRAKMAKWERMSEDDYSDRVGALDKVNHSSVRDIFTDQNDTLGTVAGFFDFHFAQAKDDIFGTRPWLAATPEGKDDIELADTMTKHAQWKFNQSDIEPSLLDGLKVSTWGGTAFVKTIHHKEIDSFTRTVNAATYTGIGKLPPREDGSAMAAGEHFMNAGGDYVTTAEELTEMGVSDEQNEWKEIEVEDTETIYHNVSCSVVDYKDIAFESTAKELDLRYTDVLVKFRMGILDAMAKYKIPEERMPELMGALHGYSGEAREHRAESDASRENLTAEQNANPIVHLVEGFLRCDPNGTGKLSRIHVIFSPDLNVLFAVDYLANITPGSILPIHPIRINKIPNRVFGIGYFEKYENFNNAVDRQYNGVTYRNRTNSHVYMTWQPEALFDDGEGEDTELDVSKPFKLAPDKTIDDLLDFKTAPDSNGTSVQLLNQTLQMMQMRSGITSAAQGELKGVPSASTATGTRDLQSRGATIVKSPIDEQTADIRAIVEFATIVLYANQDRDETFSWGEGRESTLLTIKAGDVQGIRANVSLTLVQAQNQAKLQSAMTAIDVVTKYIQVPEPDKVAARAAFVQALSSVGFQNAEDIIRDAAVDAEGILALCPPEIAPVVEQAFIQAGLIAAPAAQQGATPAPLTAIA